MTLVIGLVVVAAQAYAVLYLGYLWAPALAAALAARRRDAGAAGDPAVERRFAVLVSAHNEEAVIGSLLESLARQVYPAEKRQVLVVANNCTDGTAAAVRRSGTAVCHERTTGDLATKGIALSWLWERIAPDVRDCDCVLVLDADNLVAPDFLAEMNRTFDRGYRVVQSARCAKNADDSWASQLDAISEALWNLLDQAGRARLGLSAAIAGSGMAFQREVFTWLVREGTPELLEDVEWQARLMLAGIRVGYAEQAKVYDEKTSEASQLGRQRKRWVAGATVAARRYGGPLLRSGLRNGSLQQLVAGFGATKPPRSLLVGLIGLLGLTSWLLPSTPGLLRWPVWTGALGSFGAYVILGMALGRARLSTYRALLFAPAFALLMVGASVAGALRASKQRWIPTPHGQSITIDQLRTE